MSAPVGETQFVDKLIERVMRLETHASATHFDPQLDREADAALQKFQIDGLDIAPKDARGKIRAQLEDRYDETLGAALLQYEADWQATERALEQRIADSRRAPVVRDDTRELVLYRRWEGRPFREFVDAFERSDDKTEPLLPMLAESNDPVSLFRLTHEGTDTSEARVALLHRWQTIVQARQEARQDASAIDQLRVLRESAAPRMHLRMLIKEAREASRGRAAFKVARRRSS